MFISCFITLPRSISLNMAFSPQVMRQNYTEKDTTTKEFVSPALVPMNLGKETHGGEDVTAYGAGEISLS